MDDRTRGETRRRENIPVALSVDEVSGSPAAARRRRLFVGAIAMRVKGMMERERTPEPM